MSFSMHEIHTDITRQLSRYIKTAKFEDFPPFVVERAKMMVLQTLGVSLGSKDLQQNRDVVALAKELSGGNGAGEATLWCDGSKVSLEAALFAAGAMGDMLDWEDCSWTGHPSAGVIPSALLASEAYHKSGKELLTAVILGYEVYQRIAMAGRGNISGHNVFAALVPLTRLLDLNEEQINRALGIGTACSIIPVNVHEATMSDSLNYLYGMRTENAVTMVKTALLGIENMEDAFDDPTAYLAHMRNPVPEWFLKGLGKEYLLLQILIKHWPANMFVQTYVELAHQLHEQYKFDPEDIDEILLSPSVEFRHYTTEEGYLSLTQAQFSIPFGVAAVLYHPIPGSVWYQPENMRDPRLVALMNKVHAESFFPVAGLKHLIEGYHPEKFMTIRLKDGTTYRKGLFTHPGHPAHMFTREQFEERFRTAAAPVLQGNRADEAISLINRLEQLEDTSVLSAYVY